MTDLKDVVLAELASGTHTEAFADGARWAVQQAEKLAVHPAEPARPMPTREQIRAAIGDTINRRIEFVESPKAVQRAYEEAVDAVLALLNGDRS